MKVTPKNTKYGVPIIILGLAMYLIYFFILLEPLQLRYANTAGPSPLPMFILATIVATLVATVLYVGFSFAKYHKNLDAGQEIPFTAKQLFTSRTWMIQALIFNMVTLIATNWWLNDL